MTKVPFILSMRRCKSVFRMERRHHIVLAETSNRLSDCHVFPGYWQDDKLFSDRDAHAAFAMGRQSAACNCFQKNAMEAYSSVPGIGMDSKLRGNDTRAL